MSLPEKLYCIKTNGHISNLKKKLHYDWIKIEKRRRLKTCSMQQCSCSEVRLYFQLSTPCKCYVLLQCCSPDGERATPRYLCLKNHFWKYIELIEIIKYSFFTLRKITMVYVNNNHYRIGEYLFSWIHRHKKKNPQLAIKLYYLETFHYFLIRGREIWTPPFF